MEGNTAILLHGLLWPSVVAKVTVPDRLTILIWCSMYMDPTFDIPSQQGVSHRPFANSGCIFKYWLLEAFIIGAGNTGIRYWDAGSHPIRHCPRRYRHPQAKRHPAAEVLRAGDET